MLIFVWIVIGSFPDTTYFFRKEYFTMDQITAFFEGIDWDNVANVLVDYISKIDVKAACDAVWELFMNVVGVIAGAFITI